MAGSDARASDTPNAVWDEQVQQFHGGQDWQFLANFHEDFSVTTNGLGTPRAALDAATAAMATVHHYPPANQEPAISSLATFLWPDGGDNAVTGRQQLLLGNGASELIDLVVRVAPAGPWSAGPSAVQYKEYQRSAESHGRTILPPNALKSSSASLVALVNPTNPTGDYMDVETLKRWIEENVADGATCTVDESMQPWLGAAWRQDSLVSQLAWLRAQFEERGTAVYVIHSWTKLWSCTGLRLGSVVCPTLSHAEHLRRLQVPWSCNAPALVFLHHVVQDTDYLERTWALTSQWNQHARRQLDKLSGGAWHIASKNVPTFLSWLWIDMRDAAVAQQAVHLARQAGVPVRWGRPGYNMPTHVRIAVRSPELTEILLRAWTPLGAEHVPGDK